MTKHFLAVVFIVFLCVFSVLFPVAVCDDVGQTLTVRVDGDGNYTSIQEAIDAASSEDTVYVFPGIYYETVAVNKTITLLGEEKNTTIIDGSNSRFYAVLIQAQDVTLSGFTIQNSTNGIYIKGTSNNTITNSIITKNKVGIFLGNHSKNNIINDNVIVENICEGIHLFGSFDNFIFNNNITKHENFAIVLWDSSYSNVISQNFISNNKNGIGMKRWSDTNNISENNVISNRNTGIAVAYSYYNDIKNNIINNNYNGISISDASENFISKNYIANNHRGIYLYDSKDNIIYENNIFLDNDEDISEGSKTFKIPGFELVLIICAMLFVLLCKRKISI